MRDWEEEEEESAEGEFWEDRGAAGLDLLLSTVSAASIYLGFRYLRPYIATESSC
jgi:hypothetical protein